MHDIRPSDSLREEAEEVCGDSITDSTTAVFDGDIRCERAFSTIVNRKSSGTVSIGGEDADAVPLSAEGSAEN